MKSHREIQASLWSLKSIRRAVFSPDLFALFQLMDKWSSQFSESLIQLLKYLKTHGSGQFFTRIIFNPSSRIKGICFVYFSLIFLVVFFFFFAVISNTKLSIVVWNNWWALATDIIEKQSAQKKSQLQTSNCRSNFDRNRIFWLLFNLLRNQFSSIDQIKSVQLLRFIVSLLWCD